MLNFERKLDHQIIKSLEVQIPEDELEFIFSRSGGKGGQNVNKVSTKAMLKWNVLKSDALNDLQKSVIARKLKNKINGEGDLILYAQNERSQLQNKNEALEKLQNLVSEALRPVKKRIATKPKFSSQEKRLENKKKQAVKKEARRKIITE